MVGAVVPWSCEALKGCVAGACASTLLFFFFLSTLLPTVIKGAETGTETENPPPIFHSENPLTVSSSSSSSSCPPAGLTNAFSTMVRTEGVGSLYKGLVPTLIGVAPYAALNFATYDLLKKSFYGNTYDK